MISPYVKIRRVSKRYKPKPSLRESLSRPFLKYQSSQESWALRDVSFEVHSGQSLGVLGVTGAGKSTLLRLLGGVTQPSTGQVRVQGKIAALLGASGGFHPELSGIENAQIQGALLGMRRASLKASMRDFFEFAELDVDEDLPVKYYSTGMAVRLAISIAIHSDASIFLVDEVFASMDGRFQDKCALAFQRKVQEGAILILVSHDLTRIAEVCPDSVWLRRGELVGQGKSRLLVPQYQNSDLLSRKQELHA